MKERRQVVLASCLVFGIFTFVIVLSLMFPVLSPKSVKPVNSTWVNGTWTVKWGPVSYPHTNYVVNSSYGVGVGVGVRNISVSVPLGSFVVYGSLKPVYPNYVRLVNAGNSSVSVVDVVLTYGGGSYTAVPTGVKTVFPYSSVWFIFSSVPVAPSVGEGFTGYVLLGNGEQVIFSGAFS